ncbi:hypothetical protein RvY_07738 [Ramazzottius varieornatus]|uniref:Uncharacterized protein n=1 Tax=Ramazzottius varieornatus TaxID=947166 RepID=A0A1D1V3B7_RAMVA|nr:hypothetical protein RvY_07738 [Ramazzottius varieornatus]
MIATTRIEARVSLPTAMSWHFIGKIGRDVIIKCSFRSLAHVDSRTPVETFKTKLSDPFYLFQTSTPQRLRFSSFLEDRNFQRSASVISVPPSYGRVAFLLQQRQLVRLFVKAK